MNRARRKRLVRTAIRRIERATGVRLVEAAPGYYVADESAAHEEGFSGVEVSVETNVTPFRADISWYGRDCDGYHEDNREMVYYPRRDSGFRVPAQRDGWRTIYKSARLRGCWERVRSWQRDQYAEMMGY